MMIMMMWQWWEYGGSFNPHTSEGSTIILSISHMMKLWERGKVTYTCHTIKTLVDMRPGYLAPKHIQLNHYTIQNTPTK